MNNNFSCFLIFLGLLGCVEPNGSNSEVVSSKETYVYLVIDKSSSYQKRSYSYPDRLFLESLLESISSTGGKIWIDYVDLNYSDNESFYRLIPKSPNRNSTNKRSLGDLDFPEKRKREEAVLRQYNEDSVKHRALIARILDESVFYIGAQKSNLPKLKEKDYSDVHRLLNYSMRELSKDKTTLGYIIAFSDLQESLPEGKTFKLIDKPAGIKIFRLGNRSSTIPDYLDMDFEHPTEFLETVFHILNE